MQAVGGIAAGYEGVVGTIGTVGRILLAVEAAFVETAGVAVAMTCGGETGRPGGQVIVNGVGGVRCIVRNGKAHVSSSK
ncbi:hypothetical protein D3C81_2178270 [compost metagenome]